MDQIPCSKISVSLLELPIENRRQLVIVQLHHCVDVQTGPWIGTKKERL